MPQITDHQRIVIIDGSPEARWRVRSTLLEGAFERRYEFREAETAAAGLELCQPDANPPADCVIVDVHMPDMTGVEFVDHLRREHGFPHLPIVVVTGDRWISEAEQALKAGAQDYLPKDAILPEVFPRIIDNAIARHALFLQYYENERIAGLANQAKSAFIAHISHEIRTPMTAVLGYSALLEEQESDPEKLEYLHAIRRNGTFLLEIINDILDLSKIEAGKMDLERVTLCPHKLVEEVRAMMDGRALEKKLDFYVEFEGPLPEEIESDPRRLKQILVNLLGNSIKFTSTGRVYLRVKFLPGPTPQMRFEVRDTGIGMTREQMSRLFKPFSQGDSSVGQRFGGTGLGLMICQRLAEMLGGKITVRSQLHVGSIFTLHIAVGRHSENLVEAPIRPASREQSIGLPEWRLNCRVLVVDDRRDVRFLTGTFLRRAGVDVQIAEDGEQAIDFVNRIQDGEIPPVDLILLDMQMPRLDGYETATRLREMGYDRPIIALTADAMYGDMDRCLTCGCNSYLSKPIDVQKLLETVALYCAPAPQEPVDPAPVQGLEVPIRD